MILPAASLPTHVKSEAALGASVRVVEAFDVHQDAGAGVGFAVAPRLEVEDAESDLAQSAIEIGLDLVIFDGFNHPELDIDIGVEVGGGNNGPVQPEELIQNERTAQGVRIRT